MKYHKMLFAVFSLIVVSSTSFSAALEVRTSSQESERDRSRDAWQRPGEVFDAMAMKPGHRVADIGRALAI
jgi:predicted methyltransferase